MFGGMYLSLGLPVSCIHILFVTNSFGLFVATLVTFSSVLFPTKLPVVCNVLWIALFEAVVRESVAYLFCVLRKLLSILIAQTFVHVFCK